MLTKSFWFSETGVLVRAARTFAQTSIAMLGVSQFSLFTVDWLNLVGVSGAAAFLSVLMSIDRSADVSKAVAVERISEPHVETYIEPRIEVESLGCGESLR